MKKLILLLFPLILNSQVLTKDIILTDLKGKEYSVFSQLDSGKTVIVDIFACWCPPCWDYHNSHMLDGVHKRKDFFVMMIESDLATPDSSLYGKGKRTQGNWTKSKHPVFNINDRKLTEELVFNYYPTIYMILPDKRFFKIEYYDVNVGLYSPAKYAEIRNKLLIKK